MTKLVIERQKKVAWASITLSAYNYGNYIIEYAVNQLLGSVTPIVTFNSFSNTLPNRVNDVDIIFCPGATCLSVSEAPALLRLNKPVIPFAACFWGGRHRNENNNNSYIIEKLFRHIPFAARFRVKRLKYNPDLAIINKSIQPIGCRDRWTYNFLLNKGYNVQYVGCPVMYLSETDDTKDEDYVAVSLPRTNPKVFLNSVIRNFSGDNIKVLVLEDHERSILSNYPQVTKVEPQKNGRYLLDFYKNSSCVVTGRLHGCLPAVAYGKRVIYVSDDRLDTRNTLLSDIGINIFRTDSWNASDFQFIEKSRYEFLEKNMKEYVLLVKKCLGMFK